MSREVVVGLNAVIFAVTREQPRVLTVRDPELVSRGGPAVGLPFGPLDPAGDRTLELGLRRWVFEQTGLELGYVEQLYTFGDRDRYRGQAQSSRVLSVAYLALVREHATDDSSGAVWRDVYEFLPWEDWRRGSPPLISKVLAPGLHSWAAGDSPSQRRSRSERREIAFGLGGAMWDEERVLDRYELLYEAGLVAEATRDAGGGDAHASEDEADVPTGRPMVLDHRRILATALGRLRGKLKYRPVVFELLAPRFTLLQLQRVVEALAGVRLHKQNFRRLVERGGLVEGTGRLERRTGGRPAELFAFRREVLRERPAPGVGLPGLRSPARTPEGS